jgi:hypothetical protein
LASFSDERPAGLLLETVKPDIPPPLVGTVETAEVHGKTVYRSVVEGFVSQADAEAFCARMNRASVACIVWRDSKALSR